MLNLIIGKEGAGKSTLIGEKLKKSAERGESGSSNGLSAAVFLVPEQFHFSAERIVYKTVGAENSSKIKVTSFTKLAAEIVAKYGTPKPYADDIVRLLTMNRALAELKAHLEIYGGQAVKPEFSSRMLGVISQLKAAGLDAQKYREKVLKAEMPDESAALYARLSDISEIFTLYSTELSSRYADRLDDIRIAAALSAEYDLFRDKDIYIDGFDGFTGEQWLLLYEMLVRAKNVTLALTTDGEVSGKAEYRAENAVIARALAKCGDYEIPHETTILTERVRKAETASIEIFPDVYTECDSLAANIRSLVTEQGYRYKEIAVLVRDRSMLPPLESSLRRYNVSGFTDVPESIATKPLVRFCLLSLEACSLEPDAILRYIKSGFVRVPAEIGRRIPNIKPTTAKMPESTEKYPYVKNNGKTVRLSNSLISRFEKLSAKYGMKKRDWLSPFPTDKDKNFKELEPVRKYIIGTLSELKKAVTNATGGEITKALSSFMLDTNGLQATIFALCNKNKGFLKGFDIDKSLNDEYRKIWELMVSVFESFYSALEDFPISVDDYSELLLSVFGGIDIAKTPSVLDAITIGDTERTRLSRARAVFIPGFVQGVYPKGTKPDGEFTAGEIEALSDIGVEITERRMERYNHEQYIVHRALTLPEEQLFISASRQNSSWQSTEPAPLMKTIAAEYGTEIIQRSSAEYSAADAAKHRLAQIYCGNNKVFGEEKQKLSSALELTGNGEFERKLLKNRKYSENYTFGIKSDNAKKLMKRESFSPSAIERLCGCSFNYFCKYGLGISTDDAIALDARQTGTVIHYCLEKILSEYKGKYEAFTELQKPEITEKIEGYLKQFINDELMGQFGKNERFNYLLLNMKTGIAEIASRFAEDMQTSGFRPEELEKKVEAMLGDVKISGRLDRVDVLDEDGKRYVRVVDYKTGGKKIALPVIYYGLNLQMLLYLFAICGEKDTPSGVLYMPVGSGGMEKIDEPEKRGDEKLQKKNMLKSHTPSGIRFTGEMRADEKDENALKSKYAELTGASKSMKFFDIENLPEGNYESLKSYCVGLLDEKIKALYNGEIAALPVGDEIGDPSTCRYCEYSSVCHNLGGKRESITVDESKINEFTE